MSIAATTISLAIGDPHASTAIPDTTDDVGHPGDGNGAGRPPVGGDPASGCVDPLSAEWETDGGRVLLE